MVYNEKNSKLGRLNMSHNDPEAGFEMKHPGTRQLFEYWGSLRGGRVAPYKSEVTARGIGRALASNTFILEKLPDGARRFRLAGSALHDIFGMELRGMSANTLVEPNGHARLKSLLDDCLATPSVCILHCQAKAAGGEALDVEILLAPLRSDFDQMNRVLGAAHVLGRPAQQITPAPRKCAIIAANTFEFTGHERFDADAPLPGFAEPGASFDFQRPGLSTIDGGVRTGAPRRGHLKVVKD